MQKKAVEIDNFANKKVKVLLIFGLFTASQTFVFTTFTKFMQDIEVIIHVIQGRRRQIKLWRCSSMKFCFLVIRVTMFVESSMVIRFANINAWLDILFGANVSKVHHLGNCKRD